MLIFQTCIDATPRCAKLIAKETSFRSAAYRSTYGNIIIMCEIKLQADVGRVQEGCAGPR